MSDREPRARPERRPKAERSAPRERQRRPVSPRRVERGQKSFRCIHCHREVDTSAPGTQHRNHCPHCLWSRHMDVRPGDRAAECLGSMEPIAISVRKDGEWVIVHRCHGCGTLDSNRSAGDDNPLLLLRIAVRPLAMPPFPLDRLLPEIDAG